MCGADLPTPRPTPLPRDNHRPGWTTFLRHPIAHLLPARAAGSTTPPHSEEIGGGFTGLASLGSTLALHSGYGNINPLSIDYACRPRLRSRLTLGRSA